MTMSHAQLNAYSWSGNGMAADNLKTLQGPANGV